MVSIFGIYERIYQVEVELSKGVCGTVDLKKDGPQAQLDHLMKHAEQARAWLEGLSETMRTAAWVDAND